MILYPYKYILCDGANSHVDANARKEESQKRRKL